MSDLFSIFGKQSLYEIFNLESNASREKIKVAYRDLCLKLHPDRTSTNDCEKFQAMQKAYEVLMNPAKRHKYDTDGTVDQKEVIYIVTDEIADKCRKKYAGSATEEQAIRNAYNEGRGSITYVMKHVPFLLTEDKERVMDIISGLQKKKYIVTEFSPKVKAKKLPRSKHSNDEDEPKTKRQRQNE